jgi:hypothetical protein
MRRFFTILLLLLCFWAIAFPVQAATCRTVKEEAICIEKIKRSAKYPWEYRVNLSINDKKQDLMLYNCRNKVTISKNGIRQPFTEKDLGDFICQRLGV